MSASIVTVSGRGQIVIPKEIRRKLRIEAGKRLLLKTEGDRAVMTPLPDDPASSFCGIFQEGDSLTETLLKERKKERTRENKKTAR